MLYLWTEDVLTWFIQFDPIWMSLFCVEITKKKFTKANMTIIQIRLTRRWVSLLTVFMLCVCCHSIIRIHLTHKFDLFTFFSCLIIIYFGRDDDDDRNQFVCSIASVLFCVARRKSLSKLGRDTKSSGKKRYDLPDM